MAMRIGIWEAVQILAGKDPEALAVLADELAKKDYDIRTLREEVARLRSEVSRVTCSRDDAVRDAKRDSKADALRALGDGWHTLRPGGDFLVKDGAIAKVRCADPAKRDAAEDAVQNALGTWIGNWDDNGEAGIDEIPF